MSNQCQLANKDLLIILNSNSYVLQNKYLINIEKLKQLLK